MTHASDIKTWVVFALGILGLAFYSPPKHYLERQARHDVIAHGMDATARVERSTGLQTVIVRWTDTSNQIRTGEAWTRKQVSGRTFVGKDMAIKYVDDPAVMPVILSEVPDREWANQFGLFINPAIVLVFGAMLIGGNLLVRRHRA